MAKVNVTLFRQREKENVHPKIKGRKTEGGLKLFTSYPFPQRIVILYR